jgi:lambda repressor-like predicted transcriptional regulator
MERIASTAQRKPRTKAASLRDVLREQGRSMVWLSRQTGYSVSQIGRVARREHPGSERFWKVVALALGEEVAA